MNTLGGFPVDRPPVFAVLGAYGGKLTATDLRTLYSDASAYVAGQIVLQETFGFDLVLTAFDYTLLVEAFGGQVVWFTDQSPNMKRPAARSAGDALSLPLPDPQQTARLPVVLEMTRRLAAVYKKQVPVISVVPGPCSLPALVIGMEQWMEALLFDPSLARKLLEYTAPFYLAWANALLAAGADCLVVTEGMASAEITPRDLFADQLLPHLASVFSLTNGPKILHHTGGRLNHILDLFPGLDGLVGVAVSSKDDLTEARRLIGPDLTLIGNLDSLTLPMVSAQKVYDTSMIRLRTAASCGHYILCNSAADIPLTTPPENLKAICAAAADYAAETGGGL